MHVQLCPLMQYVQEPGQSKQQKGEIESFIPTGKWGLGLWTTPSPLCLANLLCAWQYRCMWSFVKKVFWFYCNPAGSPSFGISTLSGNNRVSSIKGLDCFVLFFSLISSKYRWHALLRIFSLQWSTGDTGGAKAHGWVRLFTTGLFRPVVKVVSYTLRQQAMKCWQCCTYLMYQESNFTSFPFIYPQGSAAVMQAANWKGKRWMSQHWHLLSVKLSPFCLVKLT